MAFSFQNSGGNPFGGGGFQTTPTNNASNSGVQAQNGSDLQDIQTEAIGFQAIAGDAKVQLLPTPWPSDNLPPTTSSLLGVASRRGLLAAAGSDMVVVAYTESVRKAFEAPGGNRKPFQPELALPMPFRISQLAFSSDEEYLIITAENGGGLAVYEVQALLNGQTDIAFQIGTNEEAVRALVPNPAAEKGELIAVVTDQGKLMVANLKQKEFISGPNGPVMKDNVSCVSWSRLGKQLVAGLSNGTAYQMTPEGVGKADIPRPPSLSGDFHVSQILWLETAVFLTVHTPSNFDTNQAPASEFHIVTKQTAAAQNAQPSFSGLSKPQAGPPTYVFQKLSEVAGPFGLNRSPPHHFILRLKDFPPNLQDLLVVASSASSDVGLFTRSAAPLERSKQITNVFTSTEPADDARRAALPIGSDNATDTSPIGMALDLSATDGVFRPIPIDDEINKSDGPIPNVMILNNEGVLASWWIVYSDSIRQKTVYPGMVSQQSTQQQQPQQPSQQQPNFGSQTTQSPFGAPSFGAPGQGLGQKASPWATTAAANPTTPAFGTPAFSAPAFGAPSLPSALAAPASSFQAASGATSGPAFGQPATFGAPAAPGQKQSPWAAPSTGTSTTAPASGGFASFANQGGFAAAAAAAAAAAPSATTSTSGGFAAFADKGGFASASPAPSGGSIFGSNAPSSSSLFSGASTAFGQPEEKPSIFGQPAANDSLKSSNNANFGSGASFENSNNDTSANSFGQQETKLGGLFGTGPVNATTGGSADKPNPFAQDSSSSLFGGASSFKLSSTFIPDDSAEDDLPRPTSGSLFGSNFSNALDDVNRPTSKEGTGLENAESSDTEREEDTKPPATTESIFGRSKPVEASQTFENPFAPAKSMSPEPVRNAPTGAESETPLPPELTSRPKSAASEAPLPPDFSSASKSAASDAPLPPDFSSSPKAAAADTPLPLDFSSEPVPEDDKNDELPALAEDSDSSNVHGTGDETYSLQTDDEDGEGDDEGGFSEEGSGEDVTKDLSPVSDSNDNIGFKPESSSSAAKKGPASLFSSVNKAAQGSSSGVLFGEIPNFPPPTKTVPGSPRSPSPVRSSVPGRMKVDTQRSVSTPPTTFARSASSTPKQAPARLPTAEAFKADQVAAEQAKRAKAKADKEAREAFLAEQIAAEQAKIDKVKADKEVREAEEAQAQIDYDDILAQKQLSEEIVPTTILDEFIAHQDYIMSAQRHGIPAQVENVYRDINSMIDTLGINARNLEAFIIGHSNCQKAGGRTKECLEKGVNEWVLGEIENLTSLIEKDLREELEKNRIQDVKIKLQQCSNLQAQAMKLREAHEDLKELASRKYDPESREAALGADLTADQSAMQSTVRQKFRDICSKIIVAEQDLTVLKAKLVTKGGKANVNGGSVPSIEAVVRTINKMTQMAEKKSGDVDVIENEMAKLNLFASRGPGSREGSPLTASIRSSPLGQSALRASTAARTPLRSSMKNSFGSRSSVIYQTPESIHSATPTPQNRGFGISSPMFTKSRDSLTSSMRSSMFGSPAKLNTNNIPDEVVQRVRDRMQRKKAVADALRTAVSRVAPRVMDMDHEWDD